MKGDRPPERSVLPAPKTRCSREQRLRREEADVQYLGIDWGTRRAAWCALSPGGELTEGAISADEDGLLPSRQPVGARRPWLHRDDERRGLGPRPARRV